MSETSEYSYELCGHHPTEDGRERGLTGCGEGGPYPTLRCDVSRVVMSGLSQVGGQLLLCANLTETNPPLSVSI